MKTKNKIVERVVCNLPAAKVTVAVAIAGLLRSIALVAFSFGNGLDRSAPAQQRCPRAQQPKAQ